MNSIKNFNNTSFNKFKFNNENHLNKTNNCAKGNLKKKMFSENMAVFQCESSNFNSLAHFIFVLCRKGKKLKICNIIQDILLTISKLFREILVIKIFEKLKYLKLIIIPFGLLELFRNIIENNKRKIVFFLIL